MGLQFLARCECDRCGKILETHVVRHASNALAPRSLIRQMIAREGWKQFGKVKGTLFEAYYCYWCIGNDPDLIARVATKRLQGKEV